MSIFSISPETLQAGNQKLKAHCASRNWAFDDLAVSIGVSLDSIDAMVHAKQGKLMLACRRNCEVLFNAPIWSAEEEWTLANRAAQTLGCDPLIVPLATVRRRATRAGIAALGSRLSLVELMKIAAKAAPITAPPAEQRETIAEPRAPTILDHLDAAMRNVRAWRRKLQEVKAELALWETPPPVLPEIQEAAAAKLDEAGRKFTKLCEQAANRAVWRRRQKGTGKRAFLLGENFTA